MMDKYLYDHELSFKAKGIMTILLSEEHNLKCKSVISFLLKNSKDGKDSLQNGIKELESKGYIKRKSDRNADGTFDNARFEIEVL